MGRYKSQIMVVLGLFLAILIAVVAFLGGVKVDVEITVVPPGAGEVEGQGEYGSGKRVVLKAHPEEGYVFYQWVQKGERFARDPEHAFQIWENKRLEAQFLTIEGVLQDHIQISSRPENGGTVEVETYNAHPSKILLTAIAEEGYDFTGWEVDGEKVKTKLQYVANIHEKKDIIAEFTEVEE